MFDNNAEGAVRDDPEWIIESKTYAPGGMSFKKSGSELLPF